MAAPTPLTQQQVAIYNAFNSEIYIRDQMDVQPTPLYDTITIAAGSTLGINNSFFVNVGAQSGKAFNQTNLLTSTQLISPEAFSIFQFRVYWNANVLRADLDAILPGFVLEFIIGQKVYQRGAIWYYPAGGGMSGYTTKNAESFYTNGVPSCTAARTLPTQLVIGAKATFYGQLNGPTITLSGGGTGLIMGLWLEGFYARGVA